METKPTIFIVDDDPLTRANVPRLAEATGVTTELFASAEEFLAAYDPSRPGCLLTDLQLPGMSGIELQETLTAKDIFLPVVMVSGGTDVPAVVRAMQQGAITLLQKPVGERDLRDAICRALKVDAESRQRELRRREILVRLAQLTPPERQVMDRIVTGTGNKAIALQLDVSLRTVEGRRQQVLRKMEVETPAELVALLFLVRKELERPALGD